MPIWNVGVRNIYFTYEIEDSRNFTYEIFIFSYGTDIHMKFYFQIWNCMWNFCKRSLSVMWNWPVFEYCFYSYCCYVASSWSWCERKTYWWFKKVMKLHCPPKYFQISTANVGKLSVKVQGRNCTVPDRIFLSKVEYCVSIPESAEKKF